MSDAGDFEIVSDHDPTKDITSTALAAIESFVFIEERELGDHRLDALEFLAEVWFGELDDTDVPEWCAAHRGRPFHIGSSEDGTPIELGGDAADAAAGGGDVVSVPPALVDLLIDEILGAEDPQRIVRLDGFRRVVSLWNGQACDIETLVGHLVLGHGAVLEAQQWVEGLSSAPSRQDALWLLHERLDEVHARRHRATEEA